MTMFVPVELVLGALYSHWYIQCRITELCSWPPHSLPHDTPLAEGKILDSIMCIKNTFDNQPMMKHRGTQVYAHTLHVFSISAMTLRLRFAVEMTSSCLAEFPAATALAVAVVMPFVMRMNSSGVVDFSGASLDWNTWWRHNCSFKCFTFSFVTTRIYLSKTCTQVKIKVSLKSYALTLFSCVFNLLWVPVWCTR